MDALAYTADPMRAPIVALASLLLVACSEPEPEGILLITVDTLRADRLGVYGYADSHTPTIDALAAESLRFERAYSHSSMTVPSIASLFTGKLPAEHGVFANVNRLDDLHITLAERLGSAGFASAAFIGSYALRTTRNLHQGFDSYTSSYRDSEPIRDHPENRARTLTDEAVAWLEARDPGRRFLLWIHYQEPHGPYTPEHFRPPRDDGRILSRSASQSGAGGIPLYQWLGHGRLAEYEARYDGEISEVDRQLGRLLDALRGRDLLERVVVVFTADHGESFGEGGLYCAHGEDLSEVQLRVPLLVRLPGAASAVRTDRVRHIDVAPTLLALAGVADAGLPGRSLFEDDGDRTVVAQLVRPGHRPWRSIRVGDVELLDGALGEPVRRTDASAESPPAQELFAQLERLAPWPVVSVTPALSPEEERNLKAMGYLD